MGFPLIVSLKLYRKLTRFEISRSMPTCERTPIFVSLIAPAGAARPLSTCTPGVARESDDREPRAQVGADGGPTRPKIQQRVGHEDVLRAGPFLFVEPAGWRRDKGRDQREVVAIPHVVRLQAEVAPQVGSGEQIHRQTILGLVQRQVSLRRRGDRPAIRRQSRNADQPSREVTRRLLSDRLGHTSYERTDQQARPAHPALLDCDQWLSALARNRPARYAGGFCCSRDNHL